jgi:hypothetical protein
MIGADRQWAVQESTTGRVIVDPAKAYPVYLAALKDLGDDELKAVTGFSLEVARMCFTEDLARVFGKPLHIVILRNEAWALKKWPAGAGAERGAASFRVYYNRLLARRRVIKG